MESSETKMAIEPAMRQGAALIRGERAQKWGGLGDVKAGKLM